MAGRARKRARVEEVVEEEEQQEEEGEEEEGEEEEEEEGGQDFGHDAFQAIIGQVQAQTVEGIAIFPNILSYTNGGDKQNWLGAFDDAGKREVISAFWKSKIGGAPILLGLCITPDSNWVGSRGKGQFKITSSMAHAWGIALIRHGSRAGRRVLIFDPDRKEDQAIQAKEFRFASCLRGSQSNFIKAGLNAFCLKGSHVGGKSFSLFLGGGVVDGVVTRGKGDCVRVTQQWLLKMATAVDLGKDGGGIGGDERVKGDNFVSLSP